MILPAGSRWRFSQPVPEWVVGAQPHPGEGLLCTVEQSPAWNPVVGPLRYELGDVSRAEYFEVDGVPARERYPEGTADAWVKFDGGWYDYALASDLTAVESEEAA